MPNSPAAEERRAVAGETVAGEAVAGDRVPGDGPADQGALAAELARAEDRYKRAVADLENYRKRAARQFEGRLSERTDAMLRDWLDVVDSVERALRMEPEGPLLNGLRAVLEQMEAVLARHGVRRIDALAEPFDPSRHEAVAAFPSPDVPERRVLDVIRSGFSVGDRVVRPAQVVVSRGAGGAQPGEEHDR